MKIKDIKIDATKVLTVKSFRAKSSDILAVYAWLYSKGVMPETAAQLLQQIIVDYAYIIRNSTEWDKVKDVDVIGFPRFLMSQELRNEDYHNKVLSALSPEVSQDTSHRTITDEDRIEMLERMWGNHELHEQ